MVKIRKPVGYQAASVKAQESVSGVEAGITPLPATPPPKTGVLAGRFCWVFLEEFS
jgi:hypothetical protein